MKLYTVDKLKVLKWKTSPHTYTSSPPVPGPPSGLEGEAVGSNGILLSWIMPSDANNIDGYVIR